ncbi:MAG: carboxypeptidase regulatory-like domain-containing protein, partial [Pyrinomonadaceae bacterium]|nr:carboxypeptidase regulatory-like domain-containing protein [Pyrinomonadaceae bacterium]
MKFFTCKNNIFAPMVLLAVAGLVTAATPVSAATSTTTVTTNSNLGVIKGVIRDQSGNPIADATVALFRIGTTKVLREVRSAADGSFLLRILPGKYSVLAVAQGFN